MSIKPEYNQVARIKVFGIGGAGCNAVSRMVNDGVKGVDFYVCNTDIQSLNLSKCQNKIVLGRELTKGLGAGGNPEMGQKAALESQEEIKKEGYRRRRHGIHYLRHGRRYRYRCCADLRKIRQRTGCSDRWYRHQTVRFRGKKENGSGQCRYRTDQAVR